ncbi:MAG: hypothetical protein RSA02_00800 [Bacteroidales bacterium]
MLPFSTLIAGSLRLLSDDGRLCLILPMQEIPYFEQQLSKRAYMEELSYLGIEKRRSFQILRYTKVYTKIGKDCSRVLLELGVNTQNINVEEKGLIVSNKGIPLLTQGQGQGLCIQTVDGTYTKEYQKMTEEFYL